jgi:hypothetical protein
LTAAVNPVILKESNTDIPMAITLTANYKEVLNAETVEKIDELIEDYSLEDILSFVDSYGEENIKYYELYFDAVNFNDDDIDSFIENHGFKSLEYWEQYVELWESHCQEAVEAFIDLEGIEYLHNFEESYQGYFNDEEDFVADYMNRNDIEIPDWIAIDYRETWRSNLQYDFNEENGYYFRNI